MFPMKEKEKEKKSDWTEKAKYVALGALTVAILAGSGVLFWQIEKQNRSTEENPYTDAEKVRSEVDALNKKIDDLNKALNDAKKETTTETTIKTREFGDSAQASGGEVSGMVNINTASASELDTLPGIGETYAARIIEYREANGGFQSTEEIKNVKGIGDATYEKLKDKITV